MTIENEDMTVYVGENFTITDTVASGLDFETCSAISWTMWLDKVIALQKTLGAGVTATSATVATVVVGTSDMESLAPGIYPYDVRVVTAGAAERVITTGEVTVKDSRS